MTSYGPTTHVLGAASAGVRAPTHSLSGRNETELIYPASNFGWVIPRTTDLGLIAWLQRVFESSAYPGVGLAGSRKPAGDSVIIRYTDHPHVLLEPTSVTSSCVTIYTSRKWALSLSL